MNVGKNIKLIRQRKGISQQELSKNISIRQSEISKYEQNKIGWTLDKLQQFAEGLGVSLVELIMDVDNDSGDVILQEIILELKKLKKEQRHIFLNIARQFNKGNEAVRGNPGAEEGEEKESAG